MQEDITVSLCVHLFIIFCPWRSSKIHLHFNETWLRRQLSVNFAILKGHCFRNIEQLLVKSSIEIYETSFFNNTFSVQ